MLVRMLTLSLSLFLTGSTCATETDNGWTDLFNGKDLSGWKRLGGDAEYEVMNGEIVGTTVPNPQNLNQNSFLVTEKTYADFIFEVELLVEKMNGGIQFRSESEPEFHNGLVHGYQCEVDPSERAWSAGIYDEMRRGWLYPVVYNPKARSAFKLNEWNHYRIECIGNNIRTHLNGIPVAHIVDDMTPEGFIALQVHFIWGDQKPGEQIRWKNIRIKTEDIDPAPAEDIFVANYLPNNLSDAEKCQGWELLFDGKTTAGWKGVGSDQFPDEGWSIREGNLTALSNQGGKTRSHKGIQTMEQFEAFDLQFEFRTAEGSESGITYLIDSSHPSLGLEYLILHDNAVSGTERTASLRGLIPAEEVFKHPGALAPSKWNRGRIVAYPSGKVEHWLNGTIVAEYTRGDDTFRALVERSKYAYNKDLETVKNTPILIRHQNGTVDFRSLKLRRLN